MKWEQDLVRDIRTNTNWDNKDGDPRIPWNGWDEVTTENFEALKERFLRVAENCSAILEIGVNRNGDKSFTQVFLKNKKKETIYIGIDIDDREYLKNEEENIYILRVDSSNYVENIELIMKCFEKSGATRKEFDFIFIDGWHSINQVLRDWEYTNLLTDHGIVGFHDTSCHPGPYYFTKYLDREKWIVEENCCPKDWGITFVRKNNEHN